MLAFGLPGVSEFAVLVIVYLIVCLWRILGKAGYSPWLSLLSIIPIVPLILLGVLAFRRWPSTEQGKVTDASG